MKTLIALLAALASTTALAHDSTVPHVHPHSSSLLPDYAVMLVAAALVACGVIAYRVLRKG
jgi:hypothetical protein